MNISYKMVKMFDADDIFKACREYCGRDIEGQINEHYCPPQDGAYRVSIPKDFIEHPEWYSEEESILFYILKVKCELEVGESCYIEVDY